MLPILGFGIGKNGRDPEIRDPGIRDPGIPGLQSLIKTKYLYN